MKKALGQAGLDFIANKYKELKTALSYKVDNSQITDVYDAGDEGRIPSLKALSEVEKSLRREVDKKVYKVSGKGLSANDYTDSDKAKVDAIPANPKYTDTVTEVVDNLTTSDSTKALSAKQGKTLNDSLSGKADKSDISRCKTKGYGSASSWSSASSSRDLEDWIGDFDKRTRELRDSGGGELKTWVFGQNLRCAATKMGKLVVIFFNGQDFYNWGRRPTLPSEFRPAFAYFRNASSLSNGDKEIAFNCGSGTFVSILDSGEMRLMAYGRNASRGDAFAANIVYFTD